MEEQWNPLAAALLTRAAARGRSGPRLTRADQYHAFALIKSGFAYSVISKMFAISQSSVSLLANCLVRTPGRLWRYPDVANEWTRLGEEAYLKAYLTHENYLKAARLAKGVDGHALDDRLAFHLVSNPKADSCSYGLILSFQVGDWDARIDWKPCADEVPEEARGPEGWRYAWVDRDGVAGPYESIAPYDVEPRRPDGLWMPWRTSADAFNHAYQSRGLPSPRRGRPKNNPH